MSGLTRLLRQCRKPSGAFGRLLARSMNYGHARLTRWGLTHLSIEKGYTILDVGCGGGGTVHRLASIAAEGKVYGIDFSEQSVAVSTRTNQKAIQSGLVDIKPGSVSDLPFPDNLFDLVTAVETHYFWPNLIGDLQEVRRVLKPGGTLALIGEVYKGGKYEARNGKWVEAGNMAYHGIEELRGLVTDASYAEVQVFEQYNRGWLCCVGRKPLTSSDRHNRERALS